jgi:hypothetical protein
MWTVTTCTTMGCGMLDRPYTTTKWSSKKTALLWLPVVVVVYPAIAVPTGFVVWQRRQPAGGNSKTCCGGRRTNHKNNNNNNDKHHP